MEKKEFLVKALCSGGFGMHSITMYVPYDDSQPVKNFLDDCYSAMWRAGYTSILHWQGIDDCESAKIIFKMKECEPFVRKVLEILGQRQFYVKALNDIEKKSGDAWCNDEGVWGVGGWEKERLLEEKRRFDGRISSFKECLELLGVDVDDRESKKQILTNLGFYRTELKNY